MTFLNELEALLKSRFINRPQGAYTSTLFEGGLDRILRKVGEEAGETIIAAKNQDPVELSNEAADLLFHVMVLLTQQGLGLSDVVKVLEDRHSK